MHSRLQSPHLSLFRICCAPQPYLREAGSSRAAHGEEQGQDPPSWTHMALGTSGTGGGKHWPPFSAQTQRTPDPWRDHVFSAHPSSQAFVLKAHVLGMQWEKEAPSLFHHCILLGPPRGRLREQDCSLHFESGRVVKTAGTWADVQGRARRWYMES